jgi:Zn-dependent M16 (insulinase) family peptidase
MLKALNTWIYDADPLELIAFEEPLRMVKKLAAQDGYFEQLIREYFLDNTHRSTVVLVPDPELAVRIETREKERLAAARASMDDDRIRQIVSDTRKLMELQSTPDSPESIATIPLLHRDDLEKKIRTVERGESRLHGATVLTHNLFTNGILYMDVGFDLHGLAQEDIPLAAMLGSALLEMGTQNEDYVSLSQRIATKTGGISGRPFLSAMEDNDTGITRFFLRGKCMTNRTEELLAILHDILLLPDFDNKERFRQMVLEHKSELETSLVPRGHAAVISRLRAHYNEAHWVNEQMGGVDAIFHIRRLADQVEADWPGVCRQLRRIHETLLDRNHLVFNVTVDPEAMPDVIRALENLLGKLPAPGRFTARDWHPPARARSEALTAPSQVNYVGCAANLFDAGYKMHGSALVITRYLQTAWLWEKIRVQGGAYGGMCSFDQRCGSFVFASYRDPNLAASLDAYLATGDFLENLKFSDEELTRALIGTIGQLDAYQLPDTKGYASAMRYLIDYTDKERQKLRDEVLATTQAHFNAFGQVIRKAFDNPAIAVLCSSDAAAGAGLETRTRVL